MNKKLLCAALLCGMGVAHSAVAQEFDDRWYVSASTGVNFQDSDRGTEDAIFGTLGFGKFWTPNWSVDLELNYQNPDKTSNPNLWWSQYGASVDARYHFRNADRKWWPYLLFGVGMQRHEEEFAAICIGTDDAPALRVAERVRSSIEQAVMVQGARYEGLRCTVTIGVSDSFASAAGLSQAMQQADAALYRGKNTGRNRVEQNRGQSRVNAMLDTVH